MLIIFIFILIFASIVLIASQFMPSVFGAFHRAQEKKVAETEKKLDTMFIQVNRQKLMMVYTLSPVCLGIAGFIFFNNFLAAFIGLAVGLIIPKVVVNNLQEQRRNRFQSQLGDALMVLSSSLKGGLSLLQAFEVLVEEMPSPMKDEIDLLLRENRMGVPLEESFKHLLERMRGTELQLVINSIIIARETGGDLTKILSRLTTTIRDNRKLKENMKTLVMQGKLQGMIMSVLPFIFVGWVFSFNRNHFDVMLKSDMGRMLLILAVVLQGVGMFLIKKFSTIKV